MECPYCTASLPDEDAFCEECGKPVHPPVAQPAPAASCPSCGAPPDEIAEDGYCDRCGHLARRPASDHVELVLSPDFVGVSDRGLKHQRNEDRFGMRQAGVGYVLVVCDGVSSSTQSELASSAVAEHVSQALESVLLRHSASSPERNMRVAIQEAQDALAAATAAGQSDPPSTTVVAALVNGVDVTIGWAGDSRAYWIAAGGEAQQLTADHSWMNEAVAAGVVSLEEASHSPNAHGITRWLGADAGDNARADVVHFRIPGPGYLLLCTDGLWNYAEDPAELCRLLEGAGSDPPLDITRRLIDFANAQGGHDNITAVLLRACEPANPGSENG
jgi:serine/threonine protein phosphatase PrpC